MRIIMFLKFKSGICCLYHYAGDRRTDINACEVAEVLCRLPNEKCTVC